MSNHTTLTTYGQEWHSIEVLGYGGGQVSFVGTDSEGLEWVQLVSVSDVRITTTAATS